MCDDSAGDLTKSGLQVIEKVGIGGYSTVFKAIDLESKSIVALKKVKILNPKEGLPQSFYREAKILQTIHHHNITTLYRIVKDAQYQSYLVLEYAEFDLAAIIHYKYRTSMPISDFVHFSKQIFQSIKALHDVNYAHCDIKPSNILVTKDQVIKLTDFGLCQNLNHGQYRSSKVVTPSYRSPELLLGEDQYTTAVDIWSLGCLLYEMITGLLLFRTSTDSEYSQLVSIFKILGSPPPDSPLYKLPHSDVLDSLPHYESQLQFIFDVTIPPEFSPIRPILESMLQLDPQKRPMIDDIIADSFFANDYNLPSFDISELHSFDIVRTKKHHKPKSPGRNWRKTLGLSAYPVPISVY